MNMEHNADQLKQLGNQSYKSADYKKALNYYSKAIQQNPKESAYYLNRALCYFNMKNYHQCINECLKSLKLNPNYIKALKKQAAANVQLLKFEQALCILKKANSIQKNQATLNQIQDVQHYISNFDKFNQALIAQNYSEALSCISFLVTKITDNKQLKLYKIQCLAKTGAIDQAKSTLNSLTVDHSSEILYLKGIIELYSGDSAKAKNFLSQGIRLNPQNVSCQKALNKAKKCQKFKQQGNQYIKSNNWQSAEAKYTQALNLDPYNKKLNSIIYSNRALTYMKRKMWIKAAQDLNRSIQLDPNYVKSYVKRAEVNMQRGQYSAAISDYARIQQLDPKINLKQKIQLAKKKQRQSKKKDYYAILGVSKTATDDQIKKAYKKLALKYHPDRNRNKSQVQQQEASKKFKDICEAQDVLTNSQKKKLYDSGGMDFDGDTGSGFSGFTSGMGGFPQGNGGKFTFKMNGQQMGGMGGMGGMDPSQIFSMFMGRGFGSGMGSTGRQRSSNGKSQNKNNFGGFNGGFGSFGNFGNFDDFGGFGDMGGMGGFNQFGKKTNKPSNKK